MKVTILLVAKKIGLGKVQIFFVYLWRLCVAIFIPRHYQGKWKSGEIIDHAEHLEATLGIAKNEYLLDRINGFMKSKLTLLEIGSYKGFRLFGITQFWRNAKFIGVELNPTWVEFSRNEAKKRKLANIEFLNADVTSSDFLGLFNERQFEVVITFATLIYLHPFHIERIMKELIRITNSKLILIEQTHFVNSAILSKGIPLFGQMTWARNYEFLLRKYDFANRIRNIGIEQVPMSIWRPGGGRAYCTSVLFEHEDACSRELNSRDFVL